MIGQDNSKRNNPKGRGSIRATNRYCVSRQSQTPDISPLTSAIRIATSRLETSLSCSKQTVGLLSNRDKIAVPHFLDGVNVGQCQQTEPIGRSAFPGKARSRRDAGATEAKKTVRRGLARRNLAAGGPRATALIADPRLEIELSHLQCATSKILIGSKQGGRPRKSEEKEKKRRAGKMSLGLARDATKAQRQDRRSGDPSTRLRAGWRSRERRTCSPQPWRRRATSSRFGPRTGIPASRCRAGTMPGHHSLLTPQSRSFGIGITAFLLYSPVFWDRIEPWA